jgi:hypothetical protein
MDNVSVAGAAKIRGDDVASQTNKKALLNVRLFYNELLSQTKLTLH